jgi:hypothetical protein
MRSVNTVARVRRAVISKLFAVLLVVLAMAPFTAPFSTFDLAELSADGSDHPGPPSDHKTVQDKSTAHVTLRLEVPSSSSLGFDAPGFILHADSARHSPIALRI